MIIQAPPLPPLTEGAFLRAGWQPQSVNGLVPDCSGNGKNGTLATVKPAFEVDPYFGPTMRTYANESGYTFNCALGLTTVGTWGIWYRVPSLTLPAGGYGSLIQGNNANDLVSVMTNAQCFFRADLTLNGVARNLLDNLPSRVGVATLGIVTYSDVDSKIRLYVDGALRQTSAAFVGPITNWNAGTGRVGTYSLATYSFDGNLCAPFVLNRCWSDAEVAAYYNLIAKRAAWCTTGSYLVDLSDQGGMQGAYL